MKPQLPVFTIDRVFNAPRALVWDAWTKPELLVQWFGPKGSDCRIVKQEFAPGGVIHTRMDMAGAPPMWGKFTYQEIKTQEKLTWLHSFSDEGGVNLTRHPMAPTWPLEMLTTVIFSDAPGNNTHVHLTWNLINPTDEEIATFASAMDGMAMGWGGSYERLDELFAKKLAA